VVLGVLGRDEVGRRSAVKKFGGRKKNSGRWGGLNKTPKKNCGAGPEGWGIPMGTKGRLLAAVAKGATGLGCGCGLNWEKESGLTGLKLGC